MTKFIAKVRLIDRRLSIKSFIPISSLGSIEKNTVVFDELEHIYESFNQVEKVCYKQEKTVTFEDEQFYDVVTDGAVVNGFCVFYVPLNCLVSKIFRC